MNELSYSHEKKDGGYDEEEVADNEHLKFENTLQKTSCFNENSLL